MKVLLITAGSRGDVVPFAALARRLGAEGHQATLALPDNSGVDVTGLRTASLGVDFSRVIEDQGVSPLAAMRSLRTVVRPVMHGVIVGAARIAREDPPDIIAWHPKVLSAPLIADALGIPHVLVEIVPAMTPTREFAAAGTVNADLGPLNRLTYAAAAGGRAMFAREITEAAAEMGAPRRRRDSDPRATFVPVSPVILPRPADWGESVHITGPWIDAGAAEGRGLEDAELAAFLEAGDVVYAGFGSMAAGDPDERGAALVAAARRHGVRMLVVTGLGGISVADALRGDDVLVRASVDHAAVLPRVRTAVHHGGIGTVHAALRAATPSVVVPFIADQPFWGARLHRAGLGPAPIAARRLTADRVGAALADAESYRPAVVAASTRMDAEDGTAAAVRVLEQLL